MTDQSKPHGARPHSLGEAISRLKPKWGWFVAFGALTALMGLATLLYLVVIGTIASVYMIGFAMILAGGAEIAMGLKARTWGWLAIWILVGLLYIVAGAFALAQPLVAAAAYTLLIGAALLITGVARIVAAFRLPTGNKARIGLAGGVTVVLGLMILLSWPASGLFVLGTFLGIDLLFYGLSWITFGMRLKNL